MTTLTETPFNEATTIREAQRGEMGAFGLLVRNYQKKAYAIAYGFVGNREDALEMAQESFARAYKALGRFDATMPFYPWLYRIIKNTCLNHLKRRKRRGETSLDGLLEAGFDAAADGHGPDGHAELGDLRAAIVRGLEGLSEEHREIITLRHLHEMSYLEIAECLGIPKGTVMSRLHAARRALRGRLEGTGRAEHGT